MLTATRSDVSARLAEVFQLVDLIKRSEAVPPATDSMEVKVLRGLFHVHLYAALEFSVNQGVQRFLAELNLLNPASDHLEKRLHSITLDSSFNSFRNIGEEKRWTRRVELIDEQASNTRNRISDGIFGLYLQNIWAERIETVFKCLGIDEPITPLPGYALYIDELVESRNGVAHGRFSAAGLGTRWRSPELLIRFNAISDTCFYILDCLEQQHSNRGAILPGFRASY